MIGEPATLDPYAEHASDLTSWLLRPVYPTLFRIDPGGEPVPDLAQSSVPVEGGLEVTLRDASWSNGKPVTPEDVVASFERGGDLRAEKTGGRRVLVRSDGGGAPPSPESLGAPHFVLPGGELEPKVSGGPYRIGGHTPGLQVVYEPNKKWDGEQPLLDSVAVQFIEDLDTMLALLRNGDLDAAAPPFSVNLDDRLAEAGLSVDEALGWESLRIEFDDDALGPDDRAGVAAAIERAALEKGFVRDDGRLSDTLSPEPGADGASGPFQSPAASGGPGSIQIAAAEGDELTRLLQKALQVQLREAGIDSELVTGEARIFYGEWRDDSPTEVSLVRAVGGPGGGVADVPEEGLAVPLFHLESLVTWGSGVGGFDVNPSIEGPLWNMGAWSRVGAGG